MSVLSGFRDPAGNASNVGSVGVDACCKASRTLAQSPTNCRSKDIIHHMQFFIAVSTGSSEVGGAGGDATCRALREMAHSPTYCRATYRRLDICHRVSCLTHQLQVYQSTAVDCCMCDCLDVTTQ